MHPFSVVTLAIFVAGYITARWDLVTRLYELAIFAADHGVVVSIYCMGSTYVVRNCSHNNMVYIDSSGERICYPLFFLFSPHHTHWPDSSTRSCTGEHLAAFKILYGSN